MPRLGRMQGESRCRCVTTCLALAALALFSQSGCCELNCRECWPCGKDWCGSQCGELFWHEWFSIPPYCCDPCDQCGDFDGPRRNDALYSHGNDYIGYCDRTRGHRAETVQGRPVMQSAPTPAAEPYRLAIRSPTRPGRGRGAADGFRTGVHYNEFGQRVVQRSIRRAGPRATHAGRLRGPSRVSRTTLIRVGRLIRAGHPVNWGSRRARDCSLAEHAS